MVKVISEWYLKRRIGEKLYVDWHVIEIGWHVINANKAEKYGTLSIKDAYFPAYLIGKKVKIKVEVIKDANKDKDD